MVNGNYKDINAKDQTSRKDSVFAFYKELIRLRKHPKYAETIVYGKTEPVLVDEKNIMAYFRRGGDQNLFVIGNFDSASRTVTVKELADEWKELKVLLNNCESIQIENGTITLEPHQALVIADKE